MQRRKNIPRSVKEVEYLVHCHLLRAGVASQKHGVTKEDGISEGKPTVCTCLGL